MQTGNPMGTDGFEFVEFTAPDAHGLGKVFESLGFRLVGQHRSKNVAQYRQGDINFIVNAEPKSPAETFASLQIRAPARWRFASRTPALPMNVRSGRAPNLT